jgi:hypothetical protein
MAKTKTGPATTGLTDDGLRWEDVPYNGTTYRVRELLVPEADAAYDAALQPDKTISYRMNSRLGLCSAIISPPTTLDDISTWSNVKLGTLLAAYDRINSLPPASAEGEDSAPAI